MYVCAQSGAKTYGSALGKIASFKFNRLEPTIFRPVIEKLKLIKSERKINFSKCICLAQRQCLMIKCFLYKQLCRVKKNNKLLKIDYIKAYILRKHYQAFCHEIMVTTKKHKGGVSGQRRRWQLYHPKSCSSRLTIYLNRTWHLFIPS